MNKGQNPIPDTDELYAATEARQESLRAVYSNMRETYKEINSRISARLDVIFLSISIAGLFYLLKEQGFGNIFLILSTILFFTTITINIFTLVKLQKHYTDMHWLLETILYEHSKLKHSTDDNWESSFNQIEFAIDDMHRSQKGINGWLLNYSYTLQASILLLAAITLFLGHI